MLNRVAVAGAAGTSALVYNCDVFAASVSSPLSVDHCIVEA